MVSNSRNTKSLLESKTNSQVVVQNISIRLDVYRLVFKWIVLKRYKCFGSHHINQLIKLIKDY
uniref:Uncharacterized protein n=1 Tax=Myoviridae sp. ctNQV2 TaxID=2827683 RepID=A0A8S5RZR1_9CAUD|nr:MAG TPA: hypothetical protein [Myoviridae sp. ctNQV2]